MSFNRAMYDPCAYNKRLDQSTSVLTYKLDPNKYYNCNPCRIGFGIVGGNDVSLSTCNLVDVESDLRNQTRLYSQCPERKYLPKCNLACASKSNLGLPCGNRYCSTGQKVDLPECNMIQYKPRIDNVGYSLNYPPCSASPSMVCPGRNPMLPVNTFRTYPQGSQRNIVWTQSPTQYAHNQAQMSNAGC